MTRTFLILALGFAGATAGLAQNHHEHPSATGSLSSRAREQIRDVQRAVSRFSTPEAARAAGFQPMLGWIPTMGTHWVSRQRMNDGFDLLAPDHLMFSPVDGRQKLVGVAYAMRGEPGAAMPAAFDGDLDRWHDHPFLAPGDETLHMLHVWFVESPDGAFAGHNPFLPFWAAGLEPPAESITGDSVAAVRVRELSAALALTIETPQLDRLTSRFAQPEAQAVVARHRDSIGALLPRLRSAQRTGDLPQWERLADSASHHWREIRRVYLDAAPPRARALVERLLDQLVGGAGPGH